MSTKRTRNLSPDQREQFSPGVASMSPAPHGQDDYQQLVKAVEDYLASHEISFRDLGGKWSVSKAGKRELFYGAGDAFAYATGLMGTQNE